MSKTNTYRVIVTREGDNWLADAPDLDGASTWARSLSALDRSIREAIAVTEDLPEGAEPDLVLDYEYRTGDPTLDRQAAENRADRLRLDDERRRASERTDALILQFATKGRLSTRDVAALTGVSPQRVSQVTSAAAKAAPRKSAKVVPIGGKAKPTLRSATDRRHATG